MRVEAVGPQHGGVQGGMGVLQGVLPRQLEGPVESSQATLDPGQGLGPDAAHLAARGCHRLDAGDGGGGERGRTGPSGGV